MPWQASVSTSRRGTCAFPFLAPMTTYLPQTCLADAASIVRRSNGEATLVGGGTAVILLLQLRLIAPKTLVGLRTLADVPGWTEIRLGDGELAIGGGVTLSDVAESRHVRTYAPSLAHAAAVVGNVRVRNVATIAGNLAEADYASDPPAVLVSLGASVTASDGLRARTLLVRDLLTGFYETALDGEVITGVRVPVAAGTRSSYLKYCSRSQEDRPCVGVAVSGRFAGELVESLEVVLGAVAGTPQRWPELTSELVGRRLDAAAVVGLADAYADLVDPIEDVRGSAWYRREMVRVHVRRALESLASPPLEGNYG